MKASIRNGRCFYYGKIPDRMMRGDPKRKDDYIEAIQVTKKAYTINDAMDVLLPKPYRTYLFFYVVNNVTKTVTVLRVMQDGMDWQFILKRWLKDFE